MKPHSVKTTLALITIPGLVLSGVAGCTSCNGLTGAARPTPTKDVALPLPGADVVAVVDGHRFHLSEFMALRDRLSGKDVEAVLWVGTAIHLLDKSLRTRGLELSPEHLIQIVRYAVGELTLDEARDGLQKAWSSPTQWQVSDIRSQLDGLVSKAKVVRNTQILAQLF